MYSVALNILMCNKVCNWCFFTFWQNRPALDGPGTLDAWAILDGAAVSRIWTLALIWTGRGRQEPGRKCTVKTADIKNISFEKTTLG
jgi:hypothetical protein